MVASSLVKSVPLTSVSITTFPIFLIVGLSAVLMSTSPIRFKKTGLKSFLTFLFIIFLNLSAFGDLRSIKLSELSTDTVELDFDNYWRAEQLDAQSLLSDWGVTISTSTVQKPVINRYLPNFTLNVLPKWYPVVQVPDDSLEGAALVFDLKYPVKRFGITQFIRSSGPSELDIRISAFSSEGENLGEYSFEVSRHVYFQKHCFEDSEGRAISKIIIKYSNTDEPEMVLSLLLDYISRPSFITFLPQIGVGRLPDGSYLQTSILIMNLSDTTASVVLELSDDNGDPLSVPNESGNEENTFPIDIPPMNFVEFFMIINPSGLDSGEVQNA